MKHSSVSNVIATLRRHGRNHLLVVERAQTGYPSRVRGVISRTQIERQLGAPVPVTEVANSFAEVVRMLS
jgi:CBS domain-containing protein